MIHFANSLLFIACFGSLAWGLKSFSERMPQKEAGFTPISVAGALFMSLHGICLFFFPAADGIRELAGLFLYAGALSLFWWSARISRRQPLELAYSEEEPDYLVIGGPYQYIRHPYYSSQVLVWLAGVFASGHLMLLTTTGIMLLLYMREAGAEENRFERSGMREVFLRYKARSGKFIPRPNVLKTLLSGKSIISQSDTGGPDKLAA